MDQPRFQLTQGDAVAWLRTLPAASVDLVITDPPYESLEKHRAIGTTTRLKHSKASSNDWFSIFPNARFPELFTEVYRVLKKDTHFYLFCDPETMFVAKPLAEAAGFKFWKPLIWDKCLGPDSPVWTERGVVRIADVVPGDRVAIPEGGTTPVKAVRRTSAPSVKLTLSDGTELIASRGRHARGGRSATGRRRTLHASRADADSQSSEHGRRHSCRGCCLRAARRDLLPVVRRAIRELTGGRGTSSAVVRSAGLEA
jgi:hypothetical protein